MWAGGRAPSQSGPAQFLLGHDPVSLLLRETLENTQSSFINKNHIYFVRHRFVCYSFTRAAARPRTFSSAQIINTFFMDLFELFMKGLFANEDHPGSQSTGRTGLIQIISGENV